MSFWEKEDYFQQDVEDLIKNETEESLYLEFKSSGSLSLSNEKKKEIAKDVSTFANSDGGIIIYGVEEVNHVASKYSFIDGHEFTKEWLEQVIDSRIQRRIPGIKIYPIRFENDFKKSIYLIKIPQSDLAPHMVDSKYYKRINCTTSPMEEYEVRDVMNRKNKISLEIFILNKYMDDDFQNVSFRNEISYSLEIAVKNIGLATEKYYKFELVAYDSVLQLSNNHYSDIYTKCSHHIDPLIRSTHYKILNSNPIFQGETEKLITFSIKINKQTLNSLLKKPLILKLYYSQGVIEKEINFLENLYYEGGHNSLKSRLVKDLIV